MPRRPVPDHHPAPPRAARSLRPQVRFLAVFLLLLAGGFTLLSLNQVNDRAVEPFTAAIARVSGAALDLLGEEVRMEGTVVRGPRFAVNIRNGCNGLETLLIFGAAVLVNAATAVLIVPALGASGAAAAFAVGQWTAALMTGLAYRRLYGIGWRQLTAPGSDDLAAIGRLLRRRRAMPRTTAGSNC